LESVVSTSADVHQGSLVKSQLLYQLSYAGAPHIVFGESSAACRHKHGRPPALLSNCCQSWRRWRAGRSLRRSLLCVLEVTQRARYAAGACEYARLARPDSRIPGSCRVVLGNKRSRLTWLLHLRLCIRVLRDGSSEVRSMLWTSGTLNAATT